MIPNLNIDIIYLMGVIAGDGSLNETKRSKGGYHYTFRIYAAGKKYLKLLNKLFEKNFGIEGKIIKDLRKMNTYYLVFKNAPLFFYFVINGNEIGKKKRFKIPKITTKNRKYFFEYLSGLIDTDGHIAGRRIQLKQKNKEFLNKIKLLANKYHLNCTDPKVNYTNKIPYYYIRFDNKIHLRFKTNTFLNKEK
ncbi:MAG: hypothetical protein KKB62_00185 [Nanoarchaeota archaeon]|nr:hypothetical protein [Nanoarchaeota archaeon]